MILELKQDDCQHAKKPLKALKHKSSTNYLKVPKKKKILPVADILIPKAYTALKIRSYRKEYARFRMTKDTGVSVN
jgi:hypothetical protein